MFGPVAWRLVSGSLTWCLGDCRGDANIQSSPGLTVAATVAELMVAVRAHIGFKMRARADLIPVLKSLMVFFNRLYIVGGCFSLSLEIACYSGDPVAAKNGGSSTSAQAGGQGGLTISAEDRHKLLEKKYGGKDG